MSKVFLDTNILVYSLDQSDAGKREKCRGLIKRLTSENSGVISTQVMQEFFVATTAKLGADRGCQVNCVTGIHTGTLSPNRMTN